MKTLEYNPTSETTPNPPLLKALTAKYCKRWVPVTEALPPERLNLTVMVRGDNCPAYGWLKFAAGDRRCPYFVVPQRASIKNRGADIGKPDHAKDRTDVTHWYSATPDGLPMRPDGFEDAEWGLGGGGWEPKIQNTFPS